MATTTWTDVARMGDPTSSFWTTKEGRCDLCDIYCAQVHWNDALGAWLCTSHDDEIDHEIYVAVNGNGSTS